MTGFSTDGLEDSIDKCDVNIKVFEDEIKKEIALQEEYANPPEDSTFTEDVYKKGIERSKENIIKIETAIKKERATQEEHRVMIKEAQRMEEKRNEGESSISSINIGGVEVFREETEQK